MSGPDSSRSTEAMAGRLKRAARRREGRNPVVIGLILIAVIAALTYLGFSKHIPFTHGFKLKAVVASSNSIRANSFVRIAGVNVGKVTDVARYKHTNMSVVTMEITDNGLPIHRNATLKIRPRIFLEGNFFVDLQPGTPDSPTAGDGYTIPSTNTSYPVQLDQVLSALQSNTRQDLQELLTGYGQALTHRPNALEDVSQDPSVRGLSAAQALNKSYVPGGPALENTAIVNGALLGIEPNDLSKLVASFSKVAGALDSNEASLQGLITNFNTTLAATAANSGDLQTTIRLLGPTLNNAQRAFTSLNASFPATRAFAREVLPGVRETPATIAAAFPWIAQTRGLLGPRELRGVVRQLSPATRDLAGLVDNTLKLLPQIDLLSQCLTNVVLPTGDVKILDGPLSNNVENYKEFWYTLVGLSGEGQNFDGNGSYVRFQPGGGTNLVSTGTVGTTSDQLFANAVERPIGTRPKYPGKRPPYNPSVPCYKSQPPDLNGPAAQVGPGESSVQTTSASPAAALGGGNSLASKLLKRLNPLGTTKTAAPR